MIEINITEFQEIRSDPFLSLQIVLATWRSGTFPYYRGGALKDVTRGKHIYIYYNYYHSPEEFIPKR